MRYRIIMWLAFVMSFTNQAILSGAAVSIDEAVRQALKTNQDYLTVVSQLERAEAEIQKATSGALPRLDFGSNYTRNLKVPGVVFGDTTIKFGTDNVLDVGLSLTQPIWLGGKVFTAMKIARTYKKYVQEMVDEAGAEVSFGVRRAYLGAILARDVVHVYRDALVAAQWNLDVVTKMQSQGVVSEYELLRAEVEVANLRPQLIQSEHRALTAADALKNLIGVPLNDSIGLQYEFDTTFVGRNLQLDSLQASAMNRRPALRQKDYLREITERAIKIAKSGRSFNLIFQSQYGWRYQADDFGFRGNDWTPNWTASLNFQMPLFDGFTTTAEIRKAKADHWETELSYRQLKEQIELEVREAFYAYNETGERLAAQKKTIRQAEEGLKIARLRYQNGIGTQLEVLSAETALTQSKTNHVQATHDAAVAVFRLLRVTGVDNFEELEENR